MKTFTRFLYRTLFILFCSYAPLQTLGQGNEEPIQCSYTDGSCIAIGYVFIEFVEGTPDIYRISVEYNIRQGGESNCPSIESIAFTPSFKDTGKIVVGNEEEIFGSATVEVVAAAFEAQDLTLTMTIDYESGQKERVDLQVPESFECGDLIPLAVELTSFTGKATQNGINLKWETASEENNSHFEVERSADGQMFKQIAKVNGHGNSNITQKYSYVDPDPLLGTSYYRLKQVDYDGKSEYSSTIAVANEIASEMKITMAPNPCRNGNCEVLIRGSRGARETLLELKDMSGKVMLTKVVQGGAVQLSPEEVRIYKGLFILTARSGDKVVHQRIILE